MPSHIDRRHRFEMLTVPAGLSSGGESAAERTVAPRQNSFGCGYFELSALLGVALAAALAVAAVLAPAARGQEPSALQAAAAIEEALVDTIAQAEKSVVSIARVRRQERDQSMPQPGNSDFIPNDFATGVVVDAHGLILTNAHVLGKDKSEFEGSEFFITTPDRKTYPVREVKGYDPRIDLAVLEIGATELVPIKFGNAKTLRKGQIVVVLGNPYAIARDGQASASWGIVANLGRKLGPDPSNEPGERKSTLHHFGTLIQTDAKLNWGTSGGALLNLKGEMVGLTTSVAALAGYEQAAGYALAVDDTFLRAVDRLKAGREVEYGFLGVQPTDLENAEILEGHNGTRINSVVEGTPAYRSDLRRGDVVVAVDGTPIHDTDGLMLGVGRLPPGSLVRLTVLRDGIQKQLTPELAKFRVRGLKVVTTPAPAWRGLRVDYTTAVFDLQPPLPAAFLEGGVVITEVEENSPAARAGLERDVLITHVGSTRVQSPKDFFDAVAGKEGPVELRLWISPSDRPVRRVES